MSPKEAMILDQRALRLAAEAETDAERRVAATVAVVAVGEEGEAK